MSVWHGDLRKKKPSGGRKTACRKKRRFERGSFAAETSLGSDTKRFVRGQGGNVRTRLLAASHANISNPSTGKTKRVKIDKVISNPANVDYDRRGVITRGTAIETSLGVAQVTSRPGQDSIVNAILVPKKTK
ncbi:MAG: 30S ribosomal protein S8e [Candidatus Bathyarchaeota archaeon]|nr:MAG: 30S ribosomal protein S8e [Candidatus Bathyarchaeota archaeon]